MKRSKAFNRKDLWEIEVCGLVAYSVDKTILQEWANRIENFAHQYGTPNVAYVVKYLLMPFIT